ncbi:MAG: glycine cleavage system protein GcvH [Candidatus Sumerlaeia bacterium]|nr:glycine cleavage system protein GcvH [Candidatus Sumerlaeia bacterium]
MSDSIPEDLYYTESHEYLAIEDTTGTVGITAYAAHELNEIIYLELPEEGDEVRAGEPFGTVEAVKAVFDLNSPVTGEVIAVNTAATDNPQIVIDDPYGDGWLIKVKMENVGELDELLTSDDYERHCAEH